MTNFQMGQLACAVIVVGVLYSPDLAACTCPTRTGTPDDVPTLLAAADFAFAGRVVDVEEYAFDEHDTAPCVESWPHRVVVVEVDRVWKGDVPERISLLDVLGGGSACGLTLSEGDQHVFFTQDADGFPGPRTDICTTPNATAETVEEFAISAAPRGGVDDRVEVCRRQSPASPQPAASCDSARETTGADAIAVLLLARRRRSSAKA
ncbi:MAG: hypothetical protein Q8O67_25865 [Deltaproteobacteria bacterium]|nr:hypothetical protein [Deltaproteobacteria bacterium]